MKPCVCGHDEGDHGEHDDNPNRLEVESPFGCRRCACECYQPDHAAPPEAVFD